MTIYIAFLAYLGRREELAALIPFVNGLAVVD
jgi:hypothetical protein